MPFYLGALRMLNIATGYSKNTLSCSELNEEHAGEGFISLRHILTPLWACKAKKCHCSRKFDLWPNLTRSNIDLGPKTICGIARSRRDPSNGIFREALRPSGADRQGGGSYQPPPPPDRPRYEKCPDRARVNSGGINLHPNSGGIYLRTYRNSGGINLHPNSGGIYLRTYRNFGGIILHPNSVPTVPCIVHISASIFIQYTFRYLIR